jgi:2EXR family
MASFHSFYRLPYELRHNIWECHKPLDSDSSISDLIKAIGAYIYALPRDRFWDRTPDIRNKNRILSIQKEGPSPYQALAGCSESRVVALKQIKKLLEADPNFGGWLKNPGYPYGKSNNPNLTLDVTKGELVYRCPKITDGMKDGCIHVEDLVFWEYTPPKPRNVRRSYEEDLNWSESDESDIEESY